MAAESEPYVLDFKATLLCSTTDTGAAAATKGTLGNNNRSGVAYVTMTSLFFTSFDIFLLPVMQKVIPLRCIREVTALKATLVASDGVCIVDMGGESSVFYVSHPAPAYAERIVDMLRVLMLLQMQREAVAEGTGGGHDAKDGGDEGGVVPEAQTQTQAEDLSVSAADTACSLDMSRERTSSDETLWKVRNMAITAVKSVENVGTAYLGRVDGREDCGGVGEGADTAVARVAQSSTMGMVADAPATNDMPIGKSPLARGIQVSCSIYINWDDVYVTTDV